MQVLHHRVAEDFWSAVLLTTEAFGEMTHQLVEFTDERIFSKLHGFVEPGRDPLTLLLEQPRAETTEVFRRLH